MSSLSYDFAHSINQSILGFIPAIVIEHLLDKKKKNVTRTLPETQSFNTVVMFADISGFTNLSEKLSLKGTEGAELLAFALTRYMEFLVKAIGRSGGDVFKFAGDAMIVIWPPPSQIDREEEELTLLCRQAIQSSMDIQNKLNEIKVIEDIKLSVKIGFGVGKVTILHVGGEMGRAEYLAAGDPLKEAFGSEHHAPSGGYVIVPQTVYERVKEFFKMDPLEGAPSFYRVKSVNKDQKVKMKADALMLTNKLKPSDIESIKRDLTTYIPAAVMTFIQAGQEKWSHELRRLSVMFCSLGIDLSDAQTKEGLERIQLVIKTVQKCVYKFQGSLNKLLMDDKGSTLMIIFGLHPMAHQDDPVRAVLTGLELIKELNKINCKCSLGITTGAVFAGVVGTSGSRREFSVLGDSVNLSARFMQAAIGEKEKKILVDKCTKKAAENKISFRFYMEKEVKGKTGLIPFYEPINSDNEEMNQFPYNIRSHLKNPQKGMQLQIKNFEMFGKDREEEMKTALSVFEKFLKKPDHSTSIFLMGTYGIGKSLFIRNFIDKTLKTTETFPCKYNEKATFIVSSLSCLNNPFPLNGWRNIMAKILLNFSFRMKMAPESLIIKILEDDEDLKQNIHVIADILDLKLNTKTKNIAKEHEQKIILNILFKILQNYLEEFNMNQSSDSQIMPSKKEKDRELSTCPLLVVLEDMQDFDQISWIFTKKVLKKLKKVFIIGACRNEYCELPPIFGKKNEKPKGDEKDLKNVHKNSESRSSQEDEIGIFEIEQCLDGKSVYIIELAGLSKEDISHMLRKKLNYKEIELEQKEEKPDEPDYSNFEEKGKKVDQTANLLFDQSKTKESKSFYKKPKKSINGLKNITKDNLGYQLLKIFKDKTEGNPLDLIYMRREMVKNNYLKSKNQKLIINEKMQKCITLNQFITINAPINRIAINGEILDRLDCESYLIMKAASVIGESFDLNTLQRVNPFKETISNEKVKRLLINLEKQEFLEILDEQDHNIIYRFHNPFMREIIYQRMIFSQRRQIHRVLAEALQTIPLEKEANEKVECDKLIYHWCFAENQDFFSKELEKSKVSNKAQRSVIVKKLSSLLAKNPNNFNITLKTGILEKKSDAGYSWATRFVVMNCKDLRYYYTEENYRENQDFALGVISLKHIFNIFYLNEAESKRKWAFVIYTGSWQKKNKEMGIREFYFAADSFKELEQWTTYIEFIRAKAIYDGFVSSFGKISFPLHMGQDKIDNLDNTHKERPGLGLSRMTIMMENSRSSKNSSILVRKNTRKMTNLKNLKSQQNSFSSSSYQDNSFMNTTTNPEIHQKLKDRLNKFFAYCFTLFNSHIIENSVRKKNVSNLDLGQTTIILRKNLLMIDPVLFEDVNKTKFYPGSYESLPNDLGSPSSPKLSKGNLRDLMQEDYFIGEVGGKNENPSASKSQINQAMIQLERIDEEIEESVDLRHLKDKEISELSFLSQIKNSAVISSEEINQLYKSSKKNSLDSELKNQSTGGKEDKSEDTAKTKFSSFQKLDDELSKIQNNKLLSNVIKKKSNQTKKRVSIEEMTNTEETNGNYLSKSHKIHSKEEEEAENLKESKLFGESDLSKKIQSSLKKKSSLDCPNDSLLHSAEKQSSQKFNDFNLPFTSSNIAKYSKISNIQLNNEDVRIIIPNERTNGDTIKISDFTQNMIKSKENDEYSQSRTNNFSYHQSSKISNTSLKRDKSDKNENILSDPEDFGIKVPKVLLRKKKKEESCYRGEKNEEFKGNLNYSRIKFQMKNSN